MKKYIAEQYRPIYDKIINDIRITREEGLLLFNLNNPGLLGYLADIVRRRKNGNKAFFNRNFHVEPTNICIHKCKFCSYRKNSGHPDAWNYSPEEILDIVRRFDDKPVTEVHIVGGVHPDHSIDYYCRILRMIREHRPGLHIKAFSAIELDYIIEKSGLGIREGLIRLKENGLGSIPGGGAEIFDEKIRALICKDKSSPEMWLRIHEEAHKAGLPSNATILYGHMETYEHRIDHMERLRTLQDRTGGFNAFIPLKFKMENNEMKQYGEVSIIEDMKNYAVSRIFLDNIPHIKAYWPALGKEATQLALSFGVDDVDGTIDDTTKIYSMAGATDQNPNMTTEEICELIRRAGFTPVERDTLYKVVKEW
ncbi:MAG: aminofutalosine synthase MqnE [Bacteroidales bacterium]|nr:aminofutalosine synthase MqnE [Bacteroidales bacterium]